MKVENNIRVGQLVKIKSWLNSGDSPNDFYLVVAKHGENCELLRANKSDKHITNRRWWNASGLSLWV